VLSVFSVAKTSRRAATLKTDPQSANPTSENLPSFPWQRNLAALWIGQLIAIAGFSVTLPFLPYYVQELGITGVDQIAFWAALVSTAQGTTMALVAPVWGLLADRYGRKIMVVRAMFGGAAVIGAMGFAQNVYQLLVLRAIQGTLTGTVPAAMTLVASSTPPERRGFAIGVLQPVLARVGWEPVPGEPDPVGILRLRLLDTLGVLADPAVVREARRRFDAQGKDPDALLAALRRTLLQVVALNADASGWERLHAAARAEKTPMVRDELYVLLAMSRDPALAKRALDLALTDEPGATLTGSMMRTVAVEHPDLAFDFAATRKAQVDERIDPNERIRFYPSLAAASHNPAMPGKMDAFARQYIAEGSRRDADAAVENIHYRIQVRSERLPAVDAWLASLQPGPAH